MLVKEDFSPKQVARAIGVSESSLKRWCDQGLISIVKTAGGHRRLPLSGVLKFLRASQREAVHPEILGLPATSGKSDRMLTRVRERLSTGLLAGDEPLCRQIIFDLWLAGQHLAVIGDQVIAAAFTAIGEKWACREADVYQERRACEIMLRVLHEIQTGLTPGDPHWQALGGTPAGDQYTLPTTMAEIVLQEAGWQARSLGSSLPFDSMAAAIRENQPRLFWLSVSHIPDQQAFQDGFARLHATAAEMGTALAVGGFALRDESLRQRLRYSAFCDTMQHLAEFAGTLRSIPSGRPA